MISLQKKHDFPGFGRSEVPQKRIEKRQVTSLRILLVPHQVGAPGLALAQPSPAYGRGLNGWAMGKAWESHRKMVIQQDVEQVYDFRVEVQLK